MRTTYETKAQMMTHVDTLLAQWAGTSSMATSVSNALSIGKVSLSYTLPFATASDSDLYNRIHNASVGSTFTTKETQRYTQLLAQQTRIENIIGILERFNGENFLSITPPPPPTVTSISNTRAVNNLDFNIHTKVVA
jgi:hypothetical protein